MDGLEGHRPVLGLEEFEDIQGFGENRYEIEASGFAQGHGRGSASGRGIIGHGGIVSLMKFGA
jgi:hypothetical protein